MDQAAPHTAPLTNTLRAHNDDIGEQAEPSQSPPQPDRLLNRVLDLWLDHQEVQIAVLSSLTPRVGSKQDHPRIRWRSLQEPPASLSDLRIVEHTLTVA